MKKGLAVLSLLAATSVFAGTSYAADAEGVVAPLSEQTDVMTTSATDQVEATVVNEADQVETTDSNEIPVIYGTTIPDESIPKVEPVAGGVLQIDAATGKLVLQNGDSAVELVVSPDTLISDYVGKYVQVEGERSENSVTVSTYVVNDLFVSGTLLYDEATGKYTLNSLTNTYNLTFEKNRSEVAPYVGKEINIFGNVTYSEAGTTVTVKYIAEDFTKVLLKVIQSLNSIYNKETNTYSPAPVENKEVAPVASTESEDSTASVESENVASIEESTAAEDTEKTTVETVDPNQVVSEEVVVTP